jgi:sec-independent protein translocase protein TatA
MSTLFIPTLANLFGPQGMMIFAVLLLLFGAKKLPELARGMGLAIKEFSKAKNEIEDEIMRPPAPKTAEQIDAATTAKTEQPAGTQAQPRTDTHA